MEKQFGQMVNHIREIMSMIRNMVMEYLHGIRGKNMKGSGIMESSMERELLSLKKIKEKLGYGKMEEE